MKTKLPEGWRTMQLCDVGKIVTGNTPSKTKSENYGNDIVWIKTPDLDKTKYVDTSTEKISLKARNLIRLVPKGSVLVSCIGIIGKVAIANCELCTNQQINSIIPKKDVVDSEFLYYTIKKMRPFLEKQGSSAIVPLLNKSEFSKIEIAVPSISTQRKIVTILEKAEKAKKLRGESDELTKDFLKSVFYKMFDKVECEKMSLKDLVIEGNTISYGIVQPGNEVLNGVPILRPVDIIHNEIDFSKIKKINPEIEKVYQKTRLRGGEILMVVRGEPGPVAMTNSTVKNYNVTRGIAVINVDSSKINPRYLLEFLKSEKSQNYIKLFTKGATLRQINLADLRNLSVPIPPISVQKEFSEIIVKIENVKEQQKQSKEQIHNLFNNIMQKSFKGELVC